MSCRIRGDPRTLTTPSPFHSLYTSDDVEDIKSASTAPRLSVALPINDRNWALPPTLIAATIAVMIPIGASAKTRLSRMLKDSLKYWVVTFSPKSAMSGARSLPRLLAKSAQESATQKPAVPRMITMTLGSDGDRPLRNVGRRDRPSSERWAVDLVLPHSVFATR